MRHKHKSNIAKAMLVFVLSLSWLLTASPGLPLLFFPPKVKEVKAATNVIRLSPTIITTGTSWEVPSDWDDNNNTIEVIGGGGGGEDNGDSGGGGGGGAYSKSVNIDLNPGDAISYQVGVGGSAGAGQDGGDGGDTFFCNSNTNCADISGTAVVVGAKGGRGGGIVSTDGGGAGGAAANGVAQGTGNQKFSGGNGGDGNGTGDSGGGGGGAGGPHATNGNGCNGGNGNTASTAGGGGGGGGAGGGSCTGGSNGTSTVGGAGGNGPTGTAGGAGGNASNGGAGSNGSGGGGSDNATIGGTGGNGAQWTLVGAGGGGGGGSNSDYGGDGGLFGGGGGGGENQGGLGSRGVIVITYAGKTPGVDTWIVPSDWNDSDNSIEVIGGGGAGFSANQNTGASGGGGGAYSKSVNQNMPEGSAVTFQVGRAGILNSPNGQDTFVCSSTSNCADIDGSAVVVGAKGGNGATGQTSPGSGGAAAGGYAYGTGNAKTSGGAGATGRSQDTSGGGGGAGGPDGDGEAGGAGAASIDGGGGGGGGAGGTSSVAGSDGTATVGGDGGAGPGGSGGGSGGNAGVGADGTSGTGGGGGGGDDAFSGGQGATYNFWSGAGPGGGGGGGGDNTGADVVGGFGGEFGGGGGGGVFGGPGARGIIVVTYTTSSSVLTQNDWRVYVDDDTLALTSDDPWPLGTLDLIENSSLLSIPPANDPIDPTDEIRIRMSLVVSVEDLSASSEGFILQFKETNDCTDGGSWTDVAGAGAGSIWEFADSTITDNSTLTTNKLTVTDVAGRYNKSDPSSTNPNSVSVGQDVEWDWHLEYVGNPEAHTYCFRMIRDDSTELSAYNSDSYPKVDTRPGANDFLRHGNFWSTFIERGFFWTSQ